MGSRKGKNQTSSRRRSIGRRGSSVQNAKKHTDRNRVRRERYARDPDYAEEQKRRYRDYYREESGKTSRGPSILTGGRLLARATSRELQGRIGSRSIGPVVAPCFTVREAAQALGRSELTLRRWFRDGLIPEPRLVDTSYGYMHYSRGELKVIARVLARHEGEYEYFSHKHEATINNIWAAVQHYRDEKV